ncbi:hypothetical protein ACL6C3_28350 [Capilliphycus salinus ALCB114379]
MPSPIGLKFSFYFSDRESLQNIPKITANVEWDEQFDYSLGDVFTPVD